MVQGADGGGVRAERQVPGAVCRTANRERCRGMRGELGAGRRAGDKVRMRDHWEREGAITEEDEP